METKETKHTPTPWELGHELGNGFSIVRGLNDRDLLPVAEATYTKNYQAENRDVAKANAAFIVLAVNSHEALIQACRHLLNDLEYRKIETAGMDYARRIIAKSEGK